MCVRFIYSYFIIISYFLFSIADMLIGSHILMLRVSYVRNLAGNWKIYFLIVQMNVLLSQKIKQNLIPYYMIPLIYDFMIF